MFNRSTFSIRLHFDKNVLRCKLESLVAACKKNDSTIGSLLRRCCDDNLINKEYYAEIMYDQDYAQALKVSLSEILFLNDPKIEKNRLIHSVS